MDCMKILRAFEKFFMTIGKARAARELSRMGRPDLAMAILKND